MSHCPPLEAVMRDGRHKETPGNQQIRFELESRHTFSFIFKAKQDSSPSKQI